MTTILNANLNLKTDLKSALFIKYINVQLVNSQSCLNIKKIKQRGTLRIRVYFSLENNKKIYEFFIVLQSGFYKSDWYGYNFVDLVELILKICLITIRHSVRKISWFFGFATTSVFTKFSEFEISPDEYIRSYRASLYLQSAFYKLQNGK